MQSTLFDLPPVTEKPEGNKDPYRYFLFEIYEGEKYALMCAHIGGEVEVCKVSELTVQPHLYKSYAGANQAKHYYNGPYGPAKWQIERWDPALKKKR